MNCRHDVPAYLRRRGLRDQPSETAGGVETHARRSEESTYFREAEVICRQVFEKKKKNSEINPYDWIQ